MRRTRKRIWKAVVLTAGTLSILGGSIALSQSGGGFDLSWASVDGGGGSSQSSAFHLVGVAGQADAGVSSGGAFKLSGGYLPGTIIETRTAVKDWGAY